MHAVRAIAAQAYGAPGKVKAAFAAESSSAGTIVAKAKAVSQNLLLRRVPMCVKTTMFKVNNHV